MQSDIESLSQGGGQAPQPQKVAAPSSIGVPSEPTPPLPETKFSLPGEFGSEEPIFRPSTSAAPIEPAETGIPGAGLPKSELSFFKKPLFLRLAIGVVIAAALGFSGYYFVYPLLFSVSPPVPPVAMAPVVPPPPPPPPPVSPPPVVPQPITHQSFFKTPADKILIIQLPSSTLAVFNNALKAILPASASGFFELVVQNSSNQGLAAVDILPLLSGALDKIFLANNFEADFTAYLFRDQNGFWPGYVMKLKSGADKTALTDEIKKIESAADLKNFYLDDPGAVRGKFEDGVVKSRPTRYLLFTQKGAVFDYGWFGNYLIFSSSYNGLREAVNRLGI